VYVDTSFSRACCNIVNTTYDVVQIAYEGICYNTLTLIAAIATKILSIPITAGLLGLAIGSSCSIIAFNLYCYKYSSFSSTTQCKFENFVTQCYDAAQKYYYLRFIVALIVAAVCLVWPLAGFVIAMSLGLLLGVVSAIDLRRYQQSHVS
jgi:hypothetical protein